MGFRTINQILIKGAETREGPLCFLLHLVHPNLNIFTFECYPPYDYYYMKNIMLTAAIFLVSSILFSQEFNVTLKVKGVKEAKGDMSVALYDKAEDFPGNENYVFARDIPIESVDFAYVIGNIPAGTYAIAIYHDLDKNGEMNKNWMGIPKEPYGFSNDVMGRMGPPDFEDASFEVKSDTEVVIHLKD
jgi:uncharacterized protein (DUF2141 family)